VTETKFHRPACWMTRHPVETVPMSCPVLKGGWCGRRNSSLSAIKMLCRNENIKPEGLNPGSQHPFWLDCAVVDGRPAPGRARLARVRRSESGDCVGRAFENLGSHRVAP